MGFRKDLKDSMWEGERVLKLERLRTEVVKPNLSNFIFY